MLYRYFGIPKHAKFDPTNCLLLHAAEKPAMAKLAMMHNPTTGESVKVIDTIAPRWKQFGIYLSFDDIGRTLDRIEAEHKVNGPVACCQEMFSHWLRGNGEPATWRTLVQLLDNFGEKHLAEQIIKVVK